MNNYIPSPHYRQMDSKGRELRRIYRDLAPSLIKLPSGYDVVDARMDRERHRALREAFVKLHGRSATAGEIETIVAGAWEEVLMNHAAISETPSTEVETDNG